MPILERMSSLGLSDSDLSGPALSPTKMNLSPRSSNYSESEDEMTIFPLMDDHHHHLLSGIHSVPLQSVSEEDPTVIEETKEHLISPTKFVDVPNMRKTRALSDNFAERRSAARFNKRIVSKWKSMAVKARSLEDPWYKFHIEDYPAEVCLRHRYSAVKKTWQVDTVHIKMQPEPFARGAMRECFRVKKLSKFARRPTWFNAQNYVAKKYISEVERSILFEDIRLQLDAKLWAEEYNRHNPPKKIDITQMYALEFINRPGKPLYHLEHFMEGEYIKYNSNSGFVSEMCRQTPQVFSHFSFERSGHQLIVVDIQGVGDLYTDPQIHTIDGNGYGDGNLGTKGMALFFRSHICSEICESFGLTPFDLSKTERSTVKQLLASGRFSSDSACRGSEELCISLPAFDDDVMEHLRHRSGSMCSNEEKHSMVGSNGYVSMEQHTDDCVCMSCLDEHMHQHSALQFRRSITVESEDSGDVFDIPAARMRHKLITWNDGQNFDGFLSYYGPGSTDSLPSTNMSQEPETDEYWAEERKKSMPASALDNIALLKMQKDYFEHRNIGPGNPFGSVLGQIHLDLGRYHELGRFVKEEGLPYDRSAAWFHLDVAAKCGVMEALLTQAKIYLNLPHDLLKDFSVDDDEGDQHDENMDLGLSLMQEAAELGDRGAMLYMAEAYETGNRIGTEREKSWTEAVKYYQKIIEAAKIPHEEDDEENQPHYDALDKPDYMIQAKIAELIRKGGFGLEADPTKAGDLYTEAAEAAMEAMMGKMANKYYMLAEESYGDCEDEEEAEA